MTGKIKNQSTFDEEGFLKAPISDLPELEAVIKEHAEDKEEYSLYLDTQALNRLSLFILRENELKGFWEDYSKVVAIENKATKDIARRAFINEKILLVVSELAEGVEALRKNLVSDHLPNRMGIEEELADAVIRILDLTAAMNIPIGDVVMEKVAFNQTRPFKHGKQF